MTRTHRILIRGLVTLGLAGLFSLAGGPRLRAQNHTPNPNSLYDPEDFKPSPSSRSSGARPGSGGVRPLSQRPRFTPEFQAYFEGFDQGSVGETLFGNPSRGGGASGPSNSGRKPSDDQPGGRARTSEPTDDLYGRTRDELSLTGQKSEINDRVKSRDRDSRDRDSRDRDPGSGGSPDDVRRGLYDPRAQMTDRDVDQERHERQDRYLQYMKERDPSRRADLYREYRRDLFGSGPSTALSSGFSSRGDSSTRADSRTSGLRGDPPLAGKDRPSSRVAELNARRSGSPVLSRSATRTRSTPGLLYRSGPRAATRDRTRPLPRELFGEP